MNSMQQLLAHLRDSAATPFSNASSLAPELYWNEDVAQAEQDYIFKKDWVCAGLAAELEKPGDYLTFSVSGEPVFCVRDKANEIRAYSNVCRHRLMQLLDGRGCTKRVVCPYHAWAYDLEGKLVSAGQMQSSKAFVKSDICLPEIRVEIWNGWIYLTLNEEAESVAKLLAPLNDVVSRYSMQSYIPVVHEDHVWKTNWKLLTENFMEGYHLPVAHKNTVGAWFNATETLFPEEPNVNFSYQFFTKSNDAKYGVAHADNQLLKDDWRTTSVMPTVFPSHMYVLAPDHLWYLSLRPRSVGEVDVRFGVAIAPEVNNSFTNDKERQQWIEDLVSFFDHVNKEDRHVVESIYKGSQSDYAKVGPLSWLERELHDFQQYLASRLSQAILVE